jgi:hypothetical protein
MTAISTKETEVTKAIAAIDNQLTEMNAKLGSLVLAKQNQSETEADRASAISQVAVEQTALGGSRKLLEEILWTTQGHGCQSGPKIKFGNHNQGSQAGINHGTINSTFNNR